MKDKNGIEIKCENCVNNGACTAENNCKICPLESVVQYEFAPIRETLEARIAELQEQIKRIKDGNMDKILNAPFTQLFALRKLTKDDFSEGFKVVENEHLEHTTFELRSDIDDDRNIDLSRYTDLRNNETWWQLDFKVPNGDSEFMDMSIENETVEEVLEEFNDYRSRFYAHFALIPNVTYITTMKEERPKSNLQEEIKQLKQNVAENVANENSQHFDIAKLVKPLQWEQVDFEEWNAPLNEHGKYYEIDVSVKQLESGFWRAFVGDYILCDRKSSQEAKDALQNWVVDFVRSACGVDCEVEK